MQSNLWNKKVKTAAKRLACALLSAATALAAPAGTMTGVAAPEWPSDTGIESESGIVMDMESGAVLFGQGIHLAKAPASITKLLTALVVLESDRTKLDDMVTFTGSALNNVDSDSGNKLSLEEGDALSVEDCLYALLLLSVNQAGNALGEYVAGSQEAFVELMNERAKELGCGENTRFANASGLSDDNQYTTAYDMALISRAAFENGTLLRIASEKSHKIGPTKNNPDGVSFEVEHKLVKTTNPDSEYYYPYAVAGKTGFTSAAGQTLVTLAEKDGRRQICVTLKSTEFTHYKDTIALMDFGFNRFENLNIAEHEALLRSGQGPVDLNGISYEREDLTLDTSAVVTVPKGWSFDDLTRSIETDLPEDHPGGAAARLLYQWDGRQVGAAYITSAKKAQEEAAAQAAAPDDGNGGGASGIEAGADQDGGKKDGGKKDSGGKKTGFSFRLPRAAGPVLVLLLAGAVLIVGIVFLVIKRREEQRRRAEERRRKRMQRLKDIGCSEEEFNRMVEERLRQSRRK